MVASHELKKQMINEWYDHYSEPILKYIALMIKDFQQAEDLTHETFIKAYDHIEKFEERSNPKTWLFTIARNTTLDFIRRRKPLLLFQETFFNKTLESSPEHIVQVEENATELYHALSKLRERYREVIVLRKIKGFSIAETSQILGVKENTVKSILHRALIALEKELVKEGFCHDQL
jgi:RNA polymerase sigma-70 factor (ECF subfamily)